MTNNYIMKKILFAAIAVSIIILSCNNKSKQEGNQSSDTTAKKVTIDTVKLYDAQGNFMKDTVIVNE
jgi:uncharacterized lipoprotein NlpE involved in copper resistance